MWSSFSPDDKLIATVSWDGTMRMHSATTGELSWVTPDSGGQSWTGAFTPDSKHIAWSSERGQVVQVHDVADGKLISTLPVTFKEWCRCMTWHPDGQQLALCTGLTVYVWRPFDGLDGKFVDGEITQCFRLPKSEWRGFASIQTVKWMEHGRKLALLSTEGSSLVWDSQTNTKELFKRPQGELAAWTDDGFYYIADEGRNIGDVYLSVDGDGMVRYWRISVPGEPSWWDKKEEPAPKKEYPETGKYVNIVKQVKPKEVQEITEAKEGKELPDIPEAKEGKEVLEVTEAKKGDKVKEVSKENTRDAWVEHGAELWTAG
jgi:WD40 repeat protein